MNLTGLTKFLEYWNNNHLATGKHPEVPLNTYYFEALDAGFGFTLKWFVNQEDFDTLVKATKYKFEEGEQRIFLFFNEYRVEIELDKRGVLDSIKAELQPIRDLIDSIS